MVFSTAQNPTPPRRQQGARGAAAATSVTLYRMPTSRATPEDREDMPVLCCCAFVDRHGRDAHLADASCLDDYLTGAVPGSQLCEQLCADLDDRIRLPMHSGAVYLGVEGAIPLVVLPVLGTAACHSMLAAAALLFLVPAALMLAHNLAWRRRRRSLLFVSSLCTATSRGAFTPIRT